MDNLDVNKLLLALENVKNEELLKDDMKTLNKVKTDMIKTLHLSNKTNQELLNKLKHYRYVDELPDMKYGSYIRWINLRDPANLRLTNGGIVCEMKVGINGMIVVCRNRTNRCFQVNMTESLIFRKLSDQELVLLSALDFINSSK
jgi:hypothetical protein